MQKWKTSFLIAVLAVAGLAQTATQFEAPQVNRVASKLKCSCGCNLNMACLMPPYPCPVCRKAKGEIIAMQAAGKSDDQILAQFVAENGKDILAIGPGLLGVVGPYVALALGLGLVIMVIRRFRRPQPAADGPQIDPATLEQIEKDLAKLD
jgi:cytochrome c-type biogenesis protein CcmH/NrfF